MDFSDFKNATVMFQALVDVDGIRYDSQTAKEIPAKVEGAWLHIWPAQARISIPMSAVKWVKWLD